MSNMATKYRLIYFNVTGLAEPIRYLFAYGKISFDDYRLEYEEWKKFKPDTPFGQIPVLEINGKKYCQTVAICRYLAIQLNLRGKTEWDAFQSDIIVDTITDFRLNYAAYFKTENEEHRKNKLSEIIQIHNPYYFNKFENIARENGGHFVNNQFTWSDLFFAALSDLWMKVAGENILSNYPYLTGLKNKVDEQPEIKAYRDKRPDTIY